ncbi:MAG TPA: ABC transporter permease [Opitutaceae bacterium]|nr:ABC transporter permease [Opitutaceae bacterium]
MPWYLYLALKQLFPTGRRFPFFTAISILGVALGVAVMVIATSVMGGFGHNIRELTVNTQGDVQVRAGAGIENPAALQAQLAKIPGVIATTPFAEGPVAVIFERRPQFPGMQGIDVERVGGVVPIDRYIHDGSLADLDDDSIILGAKLAEQLGARVGDMVEVYSPLAFEKLKNDEILLPRVLRVVGYFEFGHQALDSSVVLVTLRAMQDFYGLGSIVHGVNVKIAPGLDADEAAARINAALPPEGKTRARSWIDINEDFLFVLQFEKNMIFFLLTFIIVVAAFSVTSSLLISVVRKTREIGLLGALGGKPRQVAACFCFQGFFIGFAGTVVGLGLGCGFIYFRDDILRLFTELTQSEAALVRFYQFSHLPAHYDPAYIAAIIGCTIGISTLAGLLPAWRAARLKPVEALRSE